MAKVARNSKRTTRKTAQGTNAIGLWLIGGAVVIVGLVIALVFVNQSAATIDSAQYEGLSNEWLNRTTLGDPDAPVTVQAWEDFLCPACGQWTREIKPQLTTEFVETGQVKIEYNFLPLSQHDPGATQGAMAALCAADQGAFWPYHDKLFSAAATEGAGGFTLERLIDYAQELDLDEGTFSQCVTSQEHAQIIQTSLQQAQTLGLNSTPSVLVNGERLSNPFDYEALSTAIETAAGAASAP